MLSVSVPVGNPPIVMAIMGVMGYRKRSGFLGGLTVAQIKKLSLIFMAVSISLAHVDQKAIGLVTIAASI